MMRWILAAALASVCLAQTEPCTVEGQVFHSSTGEPLKRAQIVMRSVGSGGGYGAVSDAAGRFAIANLAPGRYLISAERNGFLRAEYGGRRGALVTLTPGQRMKDVVFRLVPHSVITGRVFDEEGEPAANASITLLRRGYDRGRRTLTPAGQASANDLGEYRIPGLAAGRYYLSARHRPVPLDSGSAEEGYVTTYYPNAMDPAAAAPIEVTAAAQLRVDVTLRRARTVRISGRVTDAAAGAPERRHVMLFLMPRDGTMRSYNDRNTVVARDGRFEIRNVMPGSYMLVAHLFEDSQRYWGTQPVDAGNADVDGITVALAPGIELRGQVRVEEGGEAAFGGMRVALRPVNEIGLAASMGGAVAADGAFTLNGLAAEPYVAQVFGAPDNLYLKAVRLAETYAADHTIAVSGPAQLEIILSRNGGQVDGMVADEGRAAPGATVVLVPDESRRVRREMYKVANSDQQGRFLFRGIPPGDYRLFAWPEAPQEAWMDPEFLKPFESGGTSLSVRENGRETVQLKLLNSGEK